MTEATEATEATEWVDMVVVGAGVSGIGTAWHLQDAVPGVSFTVTGNRSAAMLVPSCAEIGTTVTVTR